MTIVRDYNALIASETYSRWNAMTDLQAPVFVTYSFATINTFDDSWLAFQATGFREMSDTVKGYFRQALAEFSSKTGAIFVETETDGAIQAMQSSGPSTSYAYYPNVSPNGQYSGQSAIVMSGGSTDPIFEPGSGAWGFDAMLHEIGHAMGLKHPHEGDKVLASDLDNSYNTLMSYNPYGPYTGPPSYNLQSFDITALRHLYGDEFDSSSAGWTYKWNEVNDTFTLSGGSLNDTLIGVSQSNIINGNGGNDKLFGRNSADILNGGSGIDTMAGGSGNDTYYVDNPGDITTETSTLASELDTVYSLVSRTLGANLEKLILTGTSAINGIGNELNNILLGNDNVNVLNGNTGRDTMVGGKGNDIYYVDDAYDITYESSTLLTEIDSVYSSSNRALGANLERLYLTGINSINGTGNALDNILVGNTAANTLCGLGGQDILIGGLGNDILNGGDGIDTASYGGATSGVTVSLALTTAQNTKGAGTDTLMNIENLLGSNYNDFLTGNSAANVLTGGGGADNMAGGTGNDIYYVDNPGDVTTETSSLATEIDTVYSNISRTLYGGYVEKLYLTGTNAINGGGNWLNNTLVGNSAANMLSGGGGNDVMNGWLGRDTMIGATGNDTYYVDDEVEVTLENVNEGYDTVFSSTNRTLGDNLERLYLTGTNSINGTGNKLNNVIVGTNTSNIPFSGNNVLAGKYGSDTLTGGTGHDTFVFDTYPDGSIDTITDFYSHFSTGQTYADTDIIQLDKTFFTKLNNVAQLTWRLTCNSSGKALDSDDYLIYNTSTGALLYDADSNGSGVATQFATLLNKPTINAADFNLVA